MGKKSRLSSAIDALAAAVDSGELLAATDGAGLIATAAAEIGQLRARVDELEAGIDKEIRKGEEWFRQSEHYKARVAELEAALRGLVDAIDNCDSDLDPCEDEWCSDLHPLSCDALPAARAALRKEPSGD